MVICGETYFGVVSKDGLCFMCGIGKHGQLGLGEGLKEAAILTPIKYFQEKNDRIIQISCSCYHTGVIRHGGTIFTFGSKGQAIDKFYRGQLPLTCQGALLGDAAEDDLEDKDEDEGKEETKYEIKKIKKSTKQWEPVELLLAGDNPLNMGGITKKAKQISCGFAHSAVITEDGELYTWGFGWFAVLGHGDRKNKTAPTKIIHWEEEDWNGDILTTAPPLIESISCGLIHSMALTNEGIVYTWGMGGHCQLGHKIPTYYKRPRLVKTLKRVGKVNYISGGTYQSAAIMENGELYVWGSFLLGALGFGDVHRSQVVPKIVGNLLHRKNTKVACGNHFVIAI